jgi:hypothetical protein
MSRFGGVPLGFQFLYAARVGGMLFHFSSCACRSEEQIAAAAKAAIETTRRLDIAGTSSGLSSAA